jgi:hypothetical protein
LARRTPPVQHPSCGGLVARELRRRCWGACSAGALAGGRAACASGWARGGRATHQSRRPPRGCAARATAPAAWPRPALRRPPGCGARPAPGRRPPGGAGPPPRCAASHVDGRDVVDLQRAREACWWWDRVPLVLRCRSGRWPAVPPGWGPTWSAAREWMASRSVPASAPVASSAPATGSGAGGLGRLARQGGAAGTRPGGGSSLAVGLLCVSMVVNCEQCGEEQNEVCWGGIACLGGRWVPICKLVVY